MGGLYATTTFRKVPRQSLRASFGCMAIKKIHKPEQMHCKADMENIERVGLNGRDDVKALALSAWLTFETSYVGDDGHDGNEDSN